MHVLQNYFIFFRLTSGGGDGFQEALKEYTAIVKNRQYLQSGKVRVNIGNIHFEQGQYLEAIKNYRMALDQIPITWKDTRFKVFIILLLFPVTKRGSNLLALILVAVELYTCTYSERGMHCVNAFIFNSKPHGNHMETTCAWVEFELHVYYIFSNSVVQLSLTNPITPVHLL